MTFSEAYKYLEEKGCEFEFDNPNLFQFSTVNVLWKGEEIGTLDSYNMTFTVDGWCHQFNYKSMWYAGQKSFTDFMEQNFFNKR